MGIILPALLAVHGIAHLPGFAVSWRLMTSADIPYRTTAFGGALEIGDAGTRLLGSLWLVVGIAFVGLAVATWMNAPWSRPYTQVALGASVVMCLAGWPDARIGLVANAVIAALLLAAPGSWFA